MFNMKSSGDKAGIGVYLLLFSYNNQIGKEKRYKAFYGLFSAKTGKYVCMRLKRLLSVHKGVKKIPITEEPPIVMFDMESNGGF